MSPLAVVRAVVLASLVAGCAGGGRPPKPAAEEPEEVDSAPPPRRRPDGGAAGPEVRAPEPGVDAGPDAAVVEARPDAAADAARPDAAAEARPADATSGDAPPASTGCRFMLCEDFEGLPEGPYPAGRAWRAGSSRMTVDGTRGARGTRRSLKVSSLTTPSEAYLRAAQSMPAFYGRVYFWIEKEPTSYVNSPVVHWNLVEARSSVSRTVVRYGGVDNTANNTWLFNVETHGMGEAGRSDSRNIANRVWHCAEWFFDQTRNEARLWWNGEERPRLHYTGDFGAKFAFPPFSSVHVGWATYQTVNAPYEVYIDEIAIDRNRIGCD